MTLYLRIIYPNSDYQLKYVNMRPRLEKIPSATSSSISVKREVGPYMDYPLHYHPEFEMIYVEKSYGVRLMGNHIGNFSEGDLMFISPNLPHVWKNDDVFYENRKNYRVDVYVIHFSEDALTANFFNLPEFVNLKKLFALGQQGLLIEGDEERKKISSLVKKVYYNSGIERIVFFLKALDALTRAKDYSLLSSAGYTNRSNLADADRINKVMGYLLENYHRDANLDEVAGLVGLNKSSFCRFFKARTNKTFSQFLNEIRVVHACKLLLKGNRKIFEVCYETGYNNISHFNRQFKLITGLTAKEYVKEYLMNIN